MKTKVTTILAILAIVAAVGAVTTLTSISLVQQAEANACNFGTRADEPTGSCAQGKIGPVHADDNTHFHNP
jgi:hypothetical protein